MARNQDMRLLEIAREKGMITEADLTRVREEHRQKGALARSPTRIAIERGILSDEDTRDLETEAWIRDLPTDLEVYRLVRLLGRGGMAVVFEAQDVSLGKAVAVKLLLPEFSASESYLARFHREARIAARLTHPNTVQVFHVGEKARTQYLVMEYVEGEPLSAMIRRCTRIDERSALDMMWGIAGALQEAAGMGIVHRDIKPGNILCSKWGVAKLADFGIAKELSDIRDPGIQQSLTMGVVGTPSYMSPEQARGKRDLDFRSDIYSLGATLYHMVTGATPFAHSTPQETMVRVVSETPRPPRAAFPELSESTAAVICKMLAKNPDQRYQDFDDLREDLAAARDGEPVSIDYDEAEELLAPSAGESAPRRRRSRTVEEPSAMRALIVAGAVALLGVILLLLAHACGG